MIGISVALTNPVRPIVGDTGSPAPVVPAVTLVTPNATDVPVNTNIALVADVPIFAGSGNLYVRQGATTVATISAANLAIVGTVATATLIGDLANATEYNIQWDEGLLLSSTGHGIAVNDNAAAHTFTTVAAAVEPTLSVIHVNHFDVAGSPPPELGGNYRAGASPTIEAGRVETNASITPNFGTTGALRWYRPEETAILQYNFRAPDYSFVEGEEYNLFAAASGIKANGSGGGAQFYVAARWEVSTGDPIVIIDDTVTIESWERKNLFDQLITTTCPANATGLHFRIICQSSNMTTGNSNVYLQGIGVWQGAAIGLPRRVEGLSVERFGVDNLIAARTLTGSGEVTYDVFKNDAEIASGLSTPAFTESGVTGTDNKYEIRAVSPLGTGPLSFPQCDLSTSVDVDGQLFSISPARRVVRSEFFARHLVVDSSQGPTDFAPVNNRAQQISDGGKTAWVNGMMENPPYDLSAAGQGLDERVSSGAPWNAAFNVDDGATDITVPANVRTTFVKAEHDTFGHANWFTVNAKGKAFREFTFVHFLDSIPAAGWIPPTFGPHAKDIPGSLFDVDLSKIRTQPSLATAGGFGSDTQRVPYDWIWLNLGDNAEGTRFFVRSTDSDYGGGTDGWGEDIATLFSHACSADRPEWQRLEAARKVVAVGCRLIAMKDNEDINLGFGAGQGGGMGLPMYAAAYLLNNAAFQATAVDTVTALSGQFRWITEAWVGVPVISDVSSGDGTADKQHTFTPDHVGLPWWTWNLNSNPIGAQASANVLSSSYLDRAAAFNLGELAGIISLINGPDGRGGMEAFLNGGAFDNTNQRAASLSWMDMLTGPNSSRWPQAGIPETVHVDLYRGARDALVAQYPKFTAPPLANVAPTLSDGPADGQINVTHSNYLRMGNPGRDNSDTRFSVDGGYQYEIIPDTGLDPYVFQGSAGYQYDIGIRHKNSEGAGPWTENIPYDTAGVVPARHVAPGTPAAVAPTNTVLPKLFRKLGTAWHRGPFEEVTSLAVGEEVYAGGGIWENGPQPTLSYEFLVDRGAGAVAVNTGNRRYTVLAGDLSVQVRVTADNGVGAPQALSAAIPVQIDPEAGLTLTATLDPYVNLNASLNRDVPAVFSVDFTGLTAADGVIWESGANIVGAALYVQGGNIILRAGNGGTPWPADCSYIEAPAPVGDGTLVWELGASEVRMWWNGVPLGSPVGAYSLPWAGTDASGFLQRQSTMTTGAPTNDFTGFTTVSGLRYYENQTVT